MEFFFLTQDIYLEVIVFILLLVVLGVIWGNRFFVWIKGMYETLTAMKLIRRNHQKIIQKLPPLPVSRDDSRAEQDIEVKGIGQQTETATGGDTTDDRQDTIHRDMMQSTLSQNEAVEPELNTGTPIPDHIPEVTEPIEVKKLKKVAEKTLPATEKVDTSHVEKIMHLVASARTLIARGMHMEAKTLIIEGLSIEKDNRDLNFLLGTLYEQEGQYDKAEYIYKDMVELHPNDLEVLEKLANVLIIEKKYTIASEIYKKIYHTTGNTETTLYMLTHISNTLEDHPNTLLYAKKYVLQWPKNPEIIGLLATVQIKLGHRRDAIDTYKHLKNLTPYSSEIAEILQKLLIEEELSNNFSDKASV